MEKKKVTQNLITYIRSLVFYLSFNRSARKFEDLIWQPASEMAISST
jgi:hypothetical protein